ncbi:MAG: hypothetical protein IJ459_02890 [Clostridia bacterium]|nr:hypothetical protein [Clostridia bacterium]
MSQIPSAYPKSAVDKPIDKGPADKPVDLDVAVTDTEPPEGKSRSMSISEALQQ